jgi:hypothetical protein
MRRKNSLAFPCIGQQAPGIYCRDSIFLVFRSSASAVWVTLCGRMGFHTFILNILLTHIEHLLFWGSILGWRYTH